MLKARVITALCLVSGLLAVLFWLPPLAVTLVFALVALLAANEWAALMQADKASRVLLLALVVAASLITGFAPQTVEFPLWGLAVLFWVLIAPLWLAGTWRLAALRSGALVLGAWLIVAACAALVSLHARNPVLLLAALAVVWVADIGAYFCGRACGRRKLAPAISPGKTWEGVAGGVAGVMLYGVLLAGYFPETRDLPLIGLLAGLLVMTALSIVGDLFESLAKRQAGLKDSGTLLPGHGGVLDRIDGLLPTLPLAALTLEWMGK